MSRRNVEAELRELALARFKVKFESEFRWAIFKQQLLLRTRIYTEVYNSDTESTGHIRAKNLIAAVETLNPILPDDCRKMAVYASAIALHSSSEKLKRSMWVCFSLAASTEGYTPLKKYRFFVPAMFRDHDLEKNEIMFSDLKEVKNISEQECNDAIKWLDTDHSKKMQYSTVSKAQVEPAPVLAIVVDPHQMLRDALQAAIDKLHDDSFSFLGQEKRQQKLNVLEAAIFLVNSTEKDISAFVKALENNPDYGFSFKPGKEPETLRLVREVVCLYPEVRVALISRREKLEAQRETQHAGNRPGLFDRLQRAVSASQEDKTLQALQLLTVPNGTLPIVVGVPVQEAEVLKSSCSA